MVTVSLTLMVWVHWDALMLLIAGLVLAVLALRRSMEEFWNDMFLPSCDNWGVPDLADKKFRRWVQRLSKGRKSRK